MNRPQVWKVFHDAFAALPADFLAAVTMSSIAVDEDTVKLTLCVERAGKIWEASHIEDMEGIRVRMLVEIVAQSAWERLLWKFGYAVSARSAALPRVEFSTPRLPRNGGAP